MEDECEMHARELYRGTEWADSDDDDDDKSEDYQRGIPGDILYIIFPHGDVDAAGWGGPAPEEATRGEFLARAPAMGLSAFDIARLQEFARGDGDGDGDGDGVALPRDTRRIFRLLRRRLLRQCVPCDGASTLTALADALDAERAAGVPRRCPRGRAVQVVTMKPILKAPETKRLKLYNMMNRLQTLLSISTCAATTWFVFSTGTGPR